MLHKLVWLSDIAPGLGSSYEEVQESEIVSECVLVFVLENGLVVEYDEFSSSESSALPS
jgi:hypothetical protein